MGAETLIFPDAEAEAASGSVIRYMLKAKAVFHSRPLREVQCWCSESPRAFCIPDLHLPIRSQRAQLGTADPGSARGVEAAQAAAHLPVFCPPRPVSGDRGRENSLSPCLVKGGRAGRSLVMDASGVVGKKKKRRENEQ